MTRFNGVRLDDEERETLINAMNIIAHMYKVTSDPILEDLLSDLELLDKCLLNGSLWTFEV